MNEVLFTLNRIYLLRSTSGSSLIEKISSKFFISLNYLVSRFHIDGHSKLNTVQP